MIIKDCTLIFHFDDGTTIQSVVEGHVETFVNTENGETTPIAISGLSKFEKDMESKIFIKLDTEFRRYKDVRHIQILGETEREV